MALVNKYTGRGLSTAQVLEQRKVYAENSLPVVKADTIWLKLFQQFNNPLIYILIFSLSIDLAIWLYNGAESVPVEALAILIILIANASLGLWQNLKSESALRHLNKLTEAHSWVVRDGELQKIESKGLVPGDVIRIESGDRIPADGKAIEPIGFMVDESILTGESAPVDVSNNQIIFSGTLAVRGLSFVQITLTGAASNMGKLASQIQLLKGDKTPLEKRLAVTGRRIAILVIILSGMLLVTGLLLMGFEYFADIFIFTVALAVAAVPESLPAVITLALALGVERMARRKAVVRRMSAVEALGSVTVIATDKTGTLTENTMTVQKLDCIDVAESYIAMALVNDADLDSEVGDPLEIGILKYVEKQSDVSINEVRGSYSIVSTRPFDTEWKYMRVSVVNPAGQTVSYFKGAPEVILAMTNFSAEDITDWQSRINHYASKGYRALALAKSIGENEAELEWLGIILLLDPPRKEIAQSMQRALAAGIRVLMITGDHPETAREIARQIGIPGEGVKTGKDIEDLSDNEFEQVLSKVNVYARVNPDHKLKIVRSLQSLQQVVAVTGDGVNDAPALKAADVGIAMGQRGSDVSREVADIVLLDDNFETIISAIEEGRGIFENIQKFLRFLFAANFAEVILISIGGLITFQAVAMGADLLLPLTAAQILWINLLTDSLPALAIAADKNQGVMSMLPRSADAPLFDRNTLKFILYVGSVGSICSIGIFLILPWFEIDRKVIQTVIFCYLTMVQLAFVNPARMSNFVPEKNWFVFSALWVTAFIQVLALTLPFLRNLLSLAPLNLEMSVFVIGMVLLSWLCAHYYSRQLRQNILATTPIK